MKDIPQLITETDVVDEINEDFSLGIISLFLKWFRFRLKF